MGVQPREEYPWIKPLTLSRYRDDLRFTLEQNPNVSMLKKIQLGALSLYLTHSERTDVNRVNSTSLATVVEIPWDAHSVSHEEFEIIMAKSSSVETLTQGEIDAQRRFIDEP